MPDIMVYCSVLKRVKTKTKKKKKDKFLAWDGRSAINLQFDL